MTLVEAKKVSSPPATMFFYGIDPGKSGAIARVTAKHKLAETIPMPQSDHELATELDMIIDNKSRSSVWVERVPKYAGNAQSGSSVATLFANYRYIVGYLEGRGIKVNLVVPQVWMKPYRLLCLNWQILTYPQRKKFLHEMAMAEFFLGKKMLPRWAADASLIALHGAQNHLAVQAATKHTHESRKRKPQS